ncbi:glycosyltransferase family 39 protein [Frankia sp. AgPm24]|uniref:glycosyltransferase family 39 protein n=1 Tax=Frankia sp. AgPm24 TaxID=631128 RepID=UPI00200DFEA9|nr:glycosyltransferase family 39 protein [Frankia sp. AgPm24]
MSETTAGYPRSVEARSMPRGGGWPWLAGFGGLGHARHRAPIRRWRTWLALICLVGLGIRLFYLVHWLHPVPVQGDPYYYHEAANLFADGRGWPDPYELRLSGHYVADAQHPPLTSVLLAIPSLFGFTSFLSHQIFSCLLGVGAIVLVALAGRRVADPATGLVAAGLAAVYPGMWLNDPLVMSETTGILTCAWLILAACRFRDRRGRLDAAVLGLALAAVMLARAELALLAFVLVVPLIGLARGLAWRRRLGLLALATLTSVLAVVPWTIYNLTRFSEPEYLSTGLGTTLAVTHCPATYYGEHLGWWSFDCVLALPPAPSERSERDVFYRHEAMTYLRAHSDRLPVVAAARLGRTWGVFHPWQQVRLDAIELRPIGLSQLGMVTLWAVEVAAAAGVVVLVRRRQAVLPLVAVPIALSLATVIVYGTTRFRAAAEPALVLLAAVAITAAAQALHRRARPGCAVPAYPTSSPSSPALDPAPSMASDRRSGKRTPNAAELTDS